MTIHHGSERQWESIEIQTLHLLPDDQSQFSSFDGRPLIYLTINDCTSFKREVLISHVLAAGTPELVWERILEAPFEESTSRNECAMTEEGIWQYSTPSINGSFSRFSSLEEQQLIKSYKTK